MLRRENGVPSRMFYSNQVMNDVLPEKLNLIVATAAHTTYNSMKKDESWTLPDYSGQYKVGTQLVEVDIEAHKQVQLPFCPRLSTIKYRIFYPTHSIAGNKATWASSDQIYGFAHFMGIGMTSLIGPALSYFLAHVKIPAYTDAEMLPGKHPVVIFSHGLGGTDTSYSAVCGNLASHGRVVFAIEHRDHSASSTMIKSCDHTETVEYISPVNQSDPAMRLRAKYMLSQRNLEIRHLLRHIRRNYTSLDLDQIHLVGHSFGAATLLHLIDSLPFLQVHDLEGKAICTDSFEASFKSAVLLDIWTQPLPEKLSLNETPILNLVSTQFSKWPLNHDRTLLLTNESLAEKRTFETIVIDESLHLSQSDGALLFPKLISFFSSRSSQLIMEETISRTLNFMQIR